MKKFILVGCVVMALFACFAGNIWAGDATLTLDDNAGSSSFVVQDSDKTHQFKVNSDGNGYFAGNVGIGTTNPIVRSGWGTPWLTLRSLSSGIAFIDTNVTNNTSYISTDNGNIEIGNMNDDGSDAVTFMKLTTDGNVGIGTTSPDIDTGTGVTRSLTIYADKAGTNAISALEIRGHEQNEGDGTDAAKVHFSGGLSGDAVRPLANIIGFHDTASNTGGLRFETIAGGVRSERVRIRNNGNVGIGTTSPAEKLEVSGNIKASGTVSQGSSREFKKNISSVSTKDAMKTLNKLNPVRFEYKTDDSGEEHLGFIAEDVPDLVAEQDRKHLNSMDITAVLTKVVQEQQRQIQEQQKVISTLLSRVKEIEGKI